MRYFIYLLFAPLGLWLTIKTYWGAALLVVCSLGYLWKAYQRLFFYLPEFKKLNAFAKIEAVGWLPVIRATGDVAKMVGYPVGRRWRKRMGSPKWQITKLAENPLGEATLESDWQPTHQN